MGGETSDNQELWKQAGFHRPLGGLLYNLIIIFIAAGLGIVISVWLFPNFILPYPEALGFINITTSFFAVYFVLLDFGIGSSIERFVAAETVTHPYRALKYIQFFIWYQMFSGLCQISVIAMWVLMGMVESELAYACWFFLIYSTVQYPGMLSVFHGMLKAYQRFDKANIIDFIQYQLFENVLKVIFILAGRWLGSLNPGVGELVGATLGAIIGTYLRDFVSAGIAAYWIKPILKDINPEFGLKYVFFPDFGWEIAKKCIWFGVRVMIPGLITPIANFAATLMIVNWLPNYSSTLGMFMLGETLSTMTTTFKFSGIGASISEAYSNKKLNLTRHYVEMAYKWAGIFGFFMVGLLFFGADIIGVIVGGSFFLVTPIIQNFLFFKLMTIFKDHNSWFITGSGKPEYQIIFSIVEQGVRLLILWMMLRIIPSGWLALVYSLGISWVANWLVSFIILNKKVVKVKINIWQTVIAPGGAALVEALFIYISKTLMLPILAGLMGELAASIVGIVIYLLISLLFIFFPVYALLGGWDEHSLKIFRKSVQISGPSKFIIKFMYSISLKLSNVSPLYNRFKMDMTDVETEMKEITELRQKK